MSPTNSRSKCEKFCRVCAVALWLFDRLTSYERSIDPMKGNVSPTISRAKNGGQVHTGRSKFLQYRICGVIPI